MQMGRTISPQSESLNNGESLDEVVITHIPSLNTWHGKSRVSFGIHLYDQGPVPWHNEEISQLMHVL